MKTGIIYKAIGPTGKVYIGKTINTLKCRIKGHKNSATNPCSPNYNCHFYRAIRKYGIQSFKWKIIETNISVCDLNGKEIYYIDKLDTFNSGYNSTKGGDGGYGRIVSKEERKKISKRQMGRGNSFYGKTHTQSVKDKISRLSKIRVGPKHPCYGKSLSDEHKKKLSKLFTGENNPFYGRSHSDRAKDKISEKAANRAMSEETKRKISRTMSVKYLGSGNPFYGRRHTDETKVKISEASKKIVKTEEHKKKISQSNKNTKREKARSKATKFHVLNEDGTDVGVWDLAIECAEDLGLCYVSILKCLNGKQKKHKGFRFKYVR